MAYRSSGIRWIVLVAGGLLLLATGGPLALPSADAATTVAARLTIASAARTEIGPFPGEWDETNATITLVTARADRIEVSFNGGTAG